MAVKPFPACQMNIAPIDAAIALSKKHQLKAEDIQQINVLVPEQDVNIVCEPIAKKRRPVNSYAAQFSIPYAVACATIKHAFGLVELELYRDPEILALADKVGYSIDPDSVYPNQSGEVVVTMKNGEVWSQREQIPRGAPERPLGSRDIIEKFRANAQLAVSSATIGQVQEAVLDMDRHNAVRLSRLLACES